MTQALRMEHITKRFPAVIANDDICLDANKGEILAIVGENGAGKSTLMSILYGHYQPTEGSIYINGEKQVIDSTAKAISLGIGMVFQHFMLVPNLSVYQNIILGREPAKGAVIDEKTAIAECTRLAKEYGLSIDVTARVDSLAMGIQQKVEILKTLYRKAEILILDEPTAVLTPAESEELYATLRDFANMGKTIIFITHKLQEVISVADRITVIRKGQLVGTIENKGITREQLAQMMVGRSVVLRVEKEQADFGKTLVEVKQVNCQSAHKNGCLHGIDFFIRRGEILGIAGIEGNGQSELVEALTGLRKVQSGEILLDGQPIHNLKPRQIKKRKVINIPEDRHVRGLILRYSVEKNLILGNHRNPAFQKGAGFLDGKKIRTYAEDLTKRYDIRGGGSQVLASSLSGGNQQKIVIAREFEQEHDFLIAAQPTRGVDVGAIEFIHKKILEARSHGKAILLISADLQEIMSLSDRIAILFEGKLMGIVDANTADEVSLGMMMGGTYETELKKV